VDNWNKFVVNVASPNPTTFWKTIKRLNKKKSTQFSAVTSNNTVLKSSKKIVECLHDHFSTRFTSPTININNEIDQEAQRIWNSLSQANHDTIRRVCNESDLKFTVDEVKKFIASMKTKTPLVSTRLIQYIIYRSVLGGKLETV
jgi:hypothetical protein